MRTAILPQAAESTGKARGNLRLIGAVAAMFCGLLLAVPLVAQVPAQQGTYPALPSETPAQFEERTEEFNYVRREVKIPMRDGVKLHTVIIVPKGAQGSRADESHG